MCSKFSENSVTVELAFSSVGCILTIYGALLLIRAIQTVKPSSKTDIIWWIAFTDFLLGVCYLGMCVSLLIDRPENRCSVPSWSWSAAIFHFFGKIFEGSSKVSLHPIS